MYIGMFVEDCLLDKCKILRSEDEKIDFWTNMKVYDILVITTLLILFNLWWRIQVLME